MTASGNTPGSSAVIHDCNTAAIAATGLQLLDKGKMMHQAFGLLLSAIHHLSLGQLIIWPSTGNCWEQDSQSKLTEILENTQEKIHLHADNKLNKL